MMKIILSLTILLLSYQGISQPDSARIFPLSIDEKLIYADEEPEYPGGNQELFKFLGKNIVYPEYEKAMGISGKTFIEFIIDSIGSVTEVKVKHGVCGGIDKEAMRVVKMMPQWKPGKHGGKPVKTKYILPVNFTIKETNGKLTLAKYPGNPCDIYDFFKKNITYPAKAKEAKISGEVKVHCKISHKGILTTAYIVSGPELLRAEALRLIYLMPQWIPGNVKSDQEVNIIIPFDLP